MKVGGFIKFSIGISLFIALLSLKYSVQDLFDLIYWINSRRISNSDPPQTVFGDFQFKPEERFDRGNLVYAWTIAIVLVVAASYAVA